MKEEVKPNIIDNNGTSYYTAIFTAKKPSSLRNGIVCKFCNNDWVQVGVQKELIDVQKQCSYFVYIKAMQALEYVIRFGRKYHELKDLQIELKKIEMNIDYCLQITQKLHMRLLPEYIQELPIYTIHEDIKELLVLLANELIDMDFLQAKKILNIIKEHYDFHP